MATGSRLILIGEGVQSLITLASRPTSTTRGNAHFSTTPSLVTAGTRSLSTESTPLRHTPLYEFHKQHGAQMVPYAGYAMPVQYANLGVLASHHHTRTAASLFDVSHMLQVRFTGPDRVKFLESLVVADLQNLAPGHMALSVLTNDQGGIIDDTVITNQPAWFADSPPSSAGGTDETALYMVLNAGCAEKDLLHIQARLDAAIRDHGLQVHLAIQSRYALLALQGPRAAEALAAAGEGSELADLDQLKFMQAKMATLRGVPIHLARCGYTGEDGFELAVPATHATHVAEWLLEQPAVELAGLGARDSLRLEAGLCLYGHELDQNTTPVEAGLTWTIGKRRRQEGGFPGAEIILGQIKNNPPRRRVGLIVQGSPARQNAIIYNEQGEQIGEVTSGIPSPSVKGQNIAMGYVKFGYHKNNTPLKVAVRKRMNPATVAKTPFVPANYYKGG
ncbi:hypothetical protein BJ085DRAFT_43133 [Dimargaris cristalligena]|uniref:Aminomethyltransferase n=1 Tax=Dimargaris cristalligena TaxID=215637 RepID=A0A4P9ZXT8_9FUNG|nr:hypothetical protein BJ085DRAFT_43133 [Dimargaris cristalligena]|eukprot:RKP37560.1 hypothetical protein BJ085DRAFT_43133 [Dimargaris cristalligena]